MLLPEQPNVRSVRVDHVAGGSSPLSSTGQKLNSNRLNRQYSRKVQQWRPSGPRYVCSDRLFPAAGCWPDVGFQVLNRRWPVCDLGNSPASSVL